MKLASLRIKNFRRFYGEQEITFSADAKKNFTIIHAENGTGKSNLLNAINWCLFGELVEGTRQKNNIINSTHLLQEPVRAFTEVGLVIEDGDNLLKFKRKQVGKNASVIKAYEGEDDYPIPDRYIKEKIESLIPKELSKYFFFHGEGLKNLTTDSSNIQTAVQDIQGVTDTKAVLDEIIRNRNTIYAKIKKSDSASDVLIKITDELETIDELIQKKEDRKQNVEEQRNGLNDELAGVSKLINNSNAALVAKNQQEKESAEKKLEIKKLDLKNHEFKKYEAIKNFSLPIINIDVAKKCADILDDLQEGGKFPADLSEELLDGIFEKEECICGTPVKVGSKEFSKLQLWKDVATSAEFTSHVLGLNKYKDYLKNTSSYVSFMLSHEETKGIIEGDIVNYEKIIQKADSFLASTSDEDISDLNKQYNDLTAQRDKKNKELNTLNEEITNLKVKRVPIKSKFDLESKKSEVDPQIKKQYEFLDVAAKRLSTMLDSYENRAKTFVKDRINEYFEKFATKDFKIEFDKNFLPIIKEKNFGGEYTSAPDSTGEGLLKNIAFVCSLIEFSNIRADEKSTSFQIEGVKSPLVIDAPFGDADGRYSGALANILTNCNAEQVIIFLSKKHYKGAFEDITNHLDNVGSRYIIDNYTTKKESKDLDIEDNKEITINNRTYTQIHINDEYPYSQLREIDG